MPLKAHNKMEDNDRGLSAGLKQAFVLLMWIIATIGSMFLMLFLTVMVVGVVFYLVQSGTISVPDSVNTTLTSIVTGFTTVVTTILSAITFTTGLITVVIVIAVFGGFIYFGKKGYDYVKNGDKGGNMGY